VPSPLDALPSCTESAYEVVERDFLFQIKHALAAGFELEDLAVMLSNDASLAPSQAGPRPSDVRGIAWCGVGDRDEIADYLRARYPEIASRLNEGPPVGTLWVVGVINGRSEVFASALDAVPEDGDAPT
jgi:hypothetical protein